MSLPTTFPSKSIMSVIQIMHFNLFIPYFTFGCYSIILKNVVFQMKYFFLFNCFKIFCYCYSVFCLKIFLRNTCFLQKRFLICITILEFLSQTMDLHQSHLKNIKKLYRYVYGTNIHFFGDFHINSKFIPKMLNSYKFSNFWI